MRSKYEGLPQIVFLALVLILVIVSLQGCASLCDRPGWDCKQVAPSNVVAALSDSATYLPPDCPAARLWQRGASVSYAGYQRKDIALVCKRGGY